MTKRRPIKRISPRRAQLTKHSGPIPTLSVSTLVEVLCAVHLSSYVESPFPDRGGLVLVGPPSVLKSTLLDIIARNYSDAVSVSDINARSLNDLRDQIAAKVIRTLVIPEFAKLYKRHVYTADNVEGTIQALIGEGFTAASFEDARINRLRARVTLLSAMVPKFQGDHFKAWEDSGFNRRLLWSLVRLERPEILEEAVEQWRLVDFKVAHVPPAPPNDFIPQHTSRVERAEMRRLVRYQPGGTHAIQVALLVKTLAALKWWYKLMGRSEREAMKTIRTFAQSLGKEGCELII
jgi:hypothetical protein